ncbi:MAG: AAA family ATPase [Candidatus Acidiferrales bacterium]
MLKRIAIENYRSCLKTVIDLDSNLSVLIGPNGSGKTNILQAIMLLHKMNQEDEVRPFRRIANRPNPRLRATFSVPGVQVNLNASVACRPDNSNNDIMVGSSQRWTLKTPDGKRTSFPIPLALAVHARHHHLDYYYARRYYLFRSVRASRSERRIEIPDVVRAALLKVFSFCTGMRYYGASQFTNPGVCPASFEIERDETRSRSLRLHGHARTLFNMYSAQKTERYRQFIEVVGPRGLRLIDKVSFKEVQTSSTEYSVRVGGNVEARRRRNLLVVPQFKIGRQTLSPNQLSEGTFKTLALLFHVITEESTALLIEEPEVCVHHGLLSSILELIKSHSRQKQMILSTHSDYVLDHVKPENVYRVALDQPAGTTVSHIPRTMNVKELRALREYLEKEGNLGEYWREGGLGDQP